MSWLTNQHAHLWLSLLWEPSSTQLEQLTSLQSLLIEFNSELNLTRLLEGEDYWVAQVFDSLWPLKNELQTPKRFRSCIDIGTGCGFPGLAIAIALPGARLTLVDSVSKKTKAVQKIAEKLGIAERIFVRNERAEKTGHNASCRGKFDLAMARAVSTAPVVAEYLIPLLKINGHALLFRGKWSLEEEKILKKALILLNANLKRIDRCELPGQQAIRHVLHIQPISKCPKTYPRATGIPTKKPLGR